MWIFDNWTWKSPLKYSKMYKTAQQENISLWNKSMVYCGKNNSNFTPFELPVGFAWHWFISLLFILCRCFWKDYTYGKIQLSDIYSNKTKGFCLFKCDKDIRIHPFVSITIVWSTVVRWKALILVASKVTSRVFPLICIIWKLNFLSCSKESLHGRY